MISERCLQLPSSDFVRILKQAEEDPSVISLGPGEPDFESPENVIKTACKALKEGKTHYSPMGGIGELKESIINSLEDKEETNVSKDEVIVTTGSNEGIFLSLMNLIDPGEEVLVPDPSFLSYEPIVELMNGYPVSIPLTMENGFQITGEMIRDKLRDPQRTQALILCDPSNPTGRVLKKKNMKDIVDIVLEYDLTLIVDEAYEKIVYSDYTSFMEFEEVRDHLLTLRSFSKSYAMPGFRVGYGIGPEGLVKSMTRTHTYTTLSAPTMSQIAAVEALEGPQDCVKEMVDEYKERRELVVSRLSDIDLFEFHPPEGSFYIFPKIKTPNLTSKEFCETMINEAGVLMVPGTEFGRYGEGFVRISFATDYELIEKALDRVEDVAGTM